MALIKCPNCNHDISDTVSKCIHCGKKISNNQASSNASKKVEKKENFKIKLQNTKETISSFKFSRKFNKNIIINMIFTFVFLILIYRLGTVITKHSGTYTLIDFYKWLLKNYFSETFVNSLNFLIIIYLIICFLASCSNKSYNKVSKIGYCLMFIVEIVFFLSIYSLGYKLNVIGFIIPIFTLIWIIVEFYLLKQGKHIEINNVDNMNNNHIESKSKHSIDDLEKLQDLLNKKAITDKEYEELKEAVINNIIGNNIPVITHKKRSQEIDANSKQCPNYDSEIEQEKETIQEVEQSDLTCKKCGTTLKENQQFCPKCGTKAKLNFQSDLTDKAKKIHINKKMVGVIVVIVVIVLIAIFNSRTNNNVLSGNETIISTVTEQEQENETESQEVKLGETIENDYLKITLDAFEVETEYKFTYEETTSVVKKITNNGIEANSGMKLVCLRGNLTNKTSNSVYTSNKFVKGEIIINGNTYSTTLKCFDTEHAESYLTVVAQQEVEYFLYAEVPENVADNIESCTINFGWAKELNTSDTALATNILDLDYTYTLQAK